MCVELWCLTFTPSYCAVLAGLYKQPADVTEYYTSDQNETTHNFVFIENVCETDS